MVAWRYGRDAVLKSPILQQNYRKNSSINFLFVAAGVRLFLALVSQTSS